MSAEAFADLWLLAGGVLLFVGALAGSYAVATLGLLLIAALLTARLWARYALSAVQYDRSLSTECVYAGETVRLEVRITNHKPLAVPWLRLEDQLDPHLHVRGFGGEAPPGRQWGIRQQVSIGWYERLCFTYEIECARRGYYRIGPVRLRSGDPFGLYEREREEADTIAVLVYPRLLPLQDLDLGRLFPFEGSRPRTGALDDPLNIAGARPYAEGDTLRQVHWRASARSPELWSKVLRPTTEPGLLILLDVASSERPWQVIDTESLERAISTAATLAHRAHAARWALGLLVNGLQSGTRHRIRLGLARGDKPFATVLEALAKAPPFPTLSFADMLRAERRKVPRGTTIVAVSAAPTASVREQIEIYRRTGHRILFVDARARRQGISA
ncbi:MAG: DUF58 domain-containing protein [Chloroflexota bacterium]|nr:DUF58 domain-containing protein [Chloroflexota bacterium]